MTMGAVVARTRWRDQRALRAIHLMLAADCRDMSPSLEETKLSRALDKPRRLVQQGDADAIHLAAGYAVSIARCHALASGNAALALAALGTVLGVGGMRLECTEAEAAAVMRALEAGWIGAADIEAWTREYAVPV